jgi:hypothetical protein
MSSACVLNTDSLNTQQAKEKDEDRQDNRGCCYLKPLDSWCWRTGMVGSHESGIDSRSSNDAPDEHRISHQRAASA